MSDRPTDESHEHDFRPLLHVHNGEFRWERQPFAEPKYAFRCDCGMVTNRPVDAAVAEKWVSTSEDPVENIVWLKQDAPSARRRRVYIGGPLNAQPVEQVGDQPSQFRDDDGNPIPDEVGDAEWSGARQRFYYWAPQAPGGITYVHLTWIDRTGRVTG